MREAKERLGSELDPDGSKEVIPVASVPSLGDKPLVDLSGKDVKFNATVAGLEPLAEKLNEAGKKILNVILTDFAVDTKLPTEKDIFKALRNACARAGMMGVESNRHDQSDFFKTIADPQFMNIVKTTGQGLIGISIVPIIAKVIEQAIEGDKTSQRWALEITGILQGKYDFYLNRYNLTHISAENINFEGKTDEELAECVASFNDVAEAEIAVGEN